MATTPSGVTITATAPDGTATDVTEAVQCLYDLVVQSMDWGSGFLSSEEAIPVARLAKVCGFKDMEEAERYLKDVLEEEAERKAHPRPYTIHTDGTFRLG